MNFRCSLSGLPLLPLLLAVCVVHGQPAAECDSVACQLPSCRCSLADSPGNIILDPIPRFVVLSFDGAVTVENYPFYQELQSMSNMYGCPATMTFFVNHENTDYTLVNDLYRNYHEIAVHSVTKKPDVENYWRNLTKEGWLAEIVQQKQMLETYGNIPASEIQGFRAPFLEVGGNAMYAALQEAGFKYDSSWPSLQYTPWFRQNDGSVLGTLWPYTLDYASVQDETVGQKPTDSFPGLWVSPITALEDNRGFPCATLEACRGVGDELETDSEAVYQFLLRNFENHDNRTFKDGRTPFGVYASSSWFHNEIRKEGFRRFLGTVLQTPDTFVVSVRQMVEWAQDPVRAFDLRITPSYHCTWSGMRPGPGGVVTEGPIFDPDCVSGDNVNCVYQNHLPISNYEVSMNICRGPCPENYPYLNNVNGSKPYPL